jgi:hypothetical protein
MSIVSDYTFFNTTRIGNDATDYSQRNLQNTNFINHRLTNLNQNSNGYVHFALSQPTLNYSGIVGGSSVGAANIDIDSQLIINSDPYRSLEKIQLYPRSYITVPYLGRGSCDPTLEAQLIQGETVSSRKSVSTISETNYMDYSTYPSIKQLPETEEVALKGWARGGTASRNM